MFLELAILSIVNLSALRTLDLANPSQFITLTVPSRTYSMKVHQLHEYLPLLYLLPRSSAVKYLAFLQESRKPSESKKTSTHAARRTRTQRLHNQIPVLWITRYGRGQWFPAGLYEGKRGNHIPLMMTTNGFFQSGKPLWQACAGLMHLGHFWGHSVSALES